MNTVNNPENLDTIFDALANQHRREFVYVLGLQPYSISQLAASRDLSLPAVHKHIKILMSSGIISIKKVGRTKVVTLNRSSLLVLQEWLAQYHAYWGTDKESLENYSLFANKINTKEDLSSKTLVKEVNKK